MVATACASCMCVWTEGNCVQFYPVALVGFGVLFLSFLSNFILYSWTFALCFSSFLQLRFPDPFCSEKSIRLVFGM